MKNSNFKNTKTTFTGLSKNYYRSSKSEMTRPS